MDSILKVGEKRGFLKIGSTRHEDKIDGVIFSRLTHRSVPVAEESVPEGFNAEMGRFGLNGSVWDKYLQEMAPFYFVVFGEYLDAMAQS